MDSFNLLHFLLGFEALAMFAASDGHVEVESNEASKFSFKEIEFESFNIGGGEASCELHPGEDSVSVRFELLGPATTSWDITLASSVFGPLTSLVQRSRASSGLLEAMVPIDVPPSPDEIKSNYSRSTSNS